MPVPELRPRYPFNARRLALTKARRLTGMLEGTMSLEGQGLDKKTLRAMTKQSARDLLAARR
jgi:hypothetical protein